MKLYEITDKYKAILEVCENAEDDTEFAMLSDKLEGLDEELNVKLDSCARVYRTLQAEAAALEEEAKRMRGKAVTLSNRADSLKYYMEKCLGIGTPIKTEFFSMRWIARDSVEIENMEVLPEKYLRTKTTVEPDKILIGQDLKAEEEVPGCRLVTKQYLQIR